MSARVVAFMNQKGGVGKTTTAVNMGSVLANECGKRVLLVDLDPQGNLSDHVGVDPDETEASVYNVLVEGLNPRRAIRRVHGFEVLPANMDLSGAELELGGLDRREFRLRDAMAPLVDQYDYVFIDFPPSLGLLIVSGLVFADEVIVPMEAEYLALRGLSQLVRTVELVTRGLNRELRISGVVFCMFDARTTLAKDVKSEVEKFFPGKVYATPVRKNVRLAEAPSHGMPVNLYDSACSGCSDYREVAAEFLDRCGDRAVQNVEVNIDDDILAQTPVFPEDAGGKGQWQRKPVWRGNGGA